MKGCCEEIDIACVHQAHRSTHSLSKEARKVKRQARLSWMKLKCRSVNDTKENETALNAACQTKPSVHFARKGFVGNDMLDTQL